MKINSLLFLFLLTVSCSQPENRIDLTGKWQFTTDSTNWSGSILLPGSMTSNGLGEDININTPWTGSINDDSYFKNEHYAKYRNSDNIKIPFWLRKRLRDSILSPIFHSYIFAMYKNESLWI